MTFCKDCFIQMVGVMSFSKDKREKFDKCPKCKRETKRTLLRDEELNFREVLSMATHERK